MAMEFCRICRSLIVDGKCSNGSSCIKSKVQWGKDPSNYFKRLEKAGKQDLISAKRVRETPHLRGLKENSK